MRRRRGRRWGARFQRAETDCFFFFSSPSPPSEPLTTCAVEQCCLPGWGLISASAQRGAVCRAAAPVYDDSLDKDPRLRILARQEQRGLGDLDFVRGLIFFFDPELLAPSLRRRICLFSRDGNMGFAFTILIFLPS